MVAREAAGTGNQVAGFHKETGSSGVVAVRRRRYGDHDLKRDVFVFRSGNGDGLGAFLPHQVVSLHMVVGADLDGAGDGPNLRWGRLSVDGEAAHQQCNNENRFHLEPLILAAPATGQIINWLRESSAPKTMQRSSSRVATAPLWKARPEMPCSTASACVAAARSRKAVKPLVRSHRRTPAETIKQGYPFRLPEPVQSTPGHPPSLLRIALLYRIGAEWGLARPPRIGQSCWMTVRGMRRFVVGQLRFAHAKCMFHAAQQATIASPDFGRAKRDSAKR